MRNRCRRVIGGKARAFAFGKNIDLNARFLVVNFRPATGRGGQNLKAAKRRDLEEFCDSIGGQDNVNVLRDAIDKAVSPYCPASAHDRFAMNCGQHVIDRLDNAPIPARQVLWIMHRCSPRQKNLR